MGDVVLFRGPMRHEGADGEEVKGPDGEARFWLSRVGVDDGFSLFLRAVEHIEQGGLQEHPDFREVWEARGTVRHLRDVVSRLAIKGGRPWRG